MNTNHIFSESASSGDDNDRDKDIQKGKYKDKEDTDKYKVLPRSNVYYIFEKQGIQLYQIWHFLKKFCQKMSTKVFR